MGKATGGSDIDPPVSASIQKRVIFEHAKLLQKEIRMGKTLTLWSAPPNTEVLVAQHKQNLSPVATETDKELVMRALVGPSVGFEPEQYLNEAKGFFVRLQPDGTPAEGSEINAKIVAPHELEGMDLDDAKFIDVADGDAELKATGDKPKQIIPTRGQM